MFVTVCVNNPLSATLRSAAASRGSSFPSSRIAASSVSAAAAVAGSSNRRSRSGFCRNTSFAVASPRRSAGLAYGTRDVPGMIGRVGTAFGDAQINIASAAVGYTPEDSDEDCAVMVVTTGAPVPQAVIDDLVAQDEFVAGRAVNLSR